MRVPSGLIGAVLLIAMAVPLVPPAHAAPAGGAFRGDPQAAAELQAAFVKFGALRTYRARVTAGGMGTIVMSFVNPDRMQMRLPEGEIVSIGAETWFRGPAGCQKMPGGRAMGPTREDIDPTKAQGTVTVQRGGPESVEGTPTMTYLTTVEAQGKTTRSKIHVTPANGMLRRMETQGQGGQVVIDYYDFDATITIAPPC